MTRFWSSLCLNDIPLEIFTAFSLSIHSSVEALVSFRPSLLWLMLTLTWLCRYLFHMLILYTLDSWVAESYSGPVLIFWGTCILFSIRALLICNPTNTDEHSFRYPFHHDSFLSPLHCSPQSSICKTVGVWSVLTVCNLSCLPIFHFRQSQI